MFGKFWTLYIERKAAPSGLTTANTYDGLNQLTEVKTTTASAGLVADYQYTVRADGTRTGLLEKILNPDNATYATTQVIWAYDGLDRLIKETYDVNADGVGQAGSVAEGDYIDIYTYDPAGNRLSKSHDAGGNGSLTADAGDAVTVYRYGTVDANGNLQLASGDNRLPWEQTTTGGSSPVTTTTVYGYDANGSLTTKSVTTSQSRTSSTVQDVYQYDLKGQLVLATVDGTTTSYAYDSAGNQVSSASNGTTTTSLVDRQNPTGYSQTLEQHVNGSARPSTSYLVGLSIVAQTDGTGTTIYLLADGQGSTRQIATSSGTVTAVYNYDAFGNAIGFNAATASTQVLYTGQQLDGGIGEYNLRARSYDPGTGRFLTQDTFSPRAGDLMNANLYMYVAGNPANFVDPTGHGLLELIVDMGIEVGQFASNAVRAGIAFERARGFVDVTNLVSATINGAIAASGNVSETQFHLPARTASLIGFTAGFIGQLITDYVPPPAGPATGSAFETGFRETADAYFEGKLFSWSTFGKVMFQTMVSAGTAYGLSWYGKQELQVTDAETFMQSVSKFLIQFDSSSLGTYVPNFFWDYMKW